MKVSISALAERELRRATQHYAQEGGPRLAGKFIREFERALALLSDQPKLGAEWEYGLRRLAMRRFPYSVVYELEGPDLLVIVVAHHRRRPGFWRDA